MYQLKVYWDGYISQLIKVECAENVISTLQVVCNIHANVKGLGVQLFNSNGEDIYDGPLNNIVFIGLREILLGVKWNGMDGTKS